MIRPLPNGKWQADFFRTGLRRQRANFDTPQGAKDWLVIRRIAADSRMPARVVTERDRLDADEAVALLPPGVRLVDTVRFYCQHHVQKRQSLQIAWTEFMKDRQASGLRQSSLKALSSLVGGKLVNKLPGRNLDELNVAMLRELLASSGVSALSRNNRRRGWVTFFEFCRKSGWLMENPAKALTKARTDDVEPQIFTPAEAHAWLNYITLHRPELLPFYGCGFFAGIRTSELEQLTWADIGEHITIPARIAKRRSSRLVPILPALRNILDRCPRGAQSDRLSALSERQRQHWSGRLHHLDDAKLPAWKSNVMRHSFISYRVATIQNVGQVALEAGNSPTMIFKHYRALVTEAAAADYFGYAAQVTAPLSLATVSN